MPEHFCGGIATQLRGADVVSLPGIAGFLHVDDFLTVSYTKTSRHGIASVTVRIETSPAQIFLDSL